METFPIDSTATYERIERIAVQLDDAGIESHFIRNRLDEPLGLIIESALGEDEIQEQAAAALDKHYQPADPLPVEVGEVLPLDTHSGRLLPPRMLKILDAVTQGAVDDPNVLATSLSEAATGPWVGDAWRHIDFPGATRNYVDGPLQGLNVHLTLGGEGAVRFTQLRQWKLVNQIAEFVADAYSAQSPGYQIDAVIGSVLMTRPENACSWWTQILPGDIVIFQAAAQRPDFLPTGHEFVSTSDDRRLIVMSPHAAPQDEVLAKRQILVDKYELGQYALTASGYG